MMASLIPYLFYAAGSLCFLVGTLIVIIRLVTQGA